MKQYSKKKIIIFWLAILIFSSSIKQINAQNSTDLSDAVYTICEYISSERFQKIKENYHPLELIDSIYLKAEKIYSGDISEMLLSTTFSTLPFDHIPIVLPALNILIKLPLPSVEKLLFERKNKNLPSGFLVDSFSKESDKDKIAHFFGNAFIAYSISFIHLSDFLGLLIELFENAFYVEGSVDARDIIINRLGQKFGEDLKKDSSLLPSQYISIYNSLLILMSTVKKY